MKIKDCMTEIGFIRQEIEHLEKQAKGLPTCGTSAWVNDDGVRFATINYRTRLINDIIKIRRDLNELRKDIERTVLEV